MKYLSILIILPLIYGCGGNTHKHCDDNKDPLFTQPVFSNYQEVQSAKDEELKDVDDSDAARQAHSKICTRKEN